jgi:hypothetical protein
MGWGNVRCQAVSVLALGLDAHSNPIMAGLVGYQWHEIGPTGVSGGSLIMGSGHTINQKTMQQPLWRCKCEDWCICQNHKLLFSTMWGLGNCASVIFATELGITFHIWKVATIVLLLQRHILPCFPVTANPVQRFAGWLRELKLKFTQ